jgi:hypothetical protein
MADVKISGLPTATTPLNGADVVPLVQNNVTSQATIANLTAGRDVSAASLIITNSSSSNALRITQTGSGNALLVEDSANPDSTPFVVDASGTVIVGHTQNIGTPLSYPLQVLGANTNTGASLANWVASSGAPNIRIAKSRGASIGTSGIVSSGDELGVIQFYGDDGSSFIRGANIIAAVDGTPGTNDMPGRLVFSTTANGASTPTERMRIKSTGQVRFVPQTEPATAQAGDVYYDSGTNKLRCYNGSIWNDLF